ncbi:MAG: calcium-binding protein [Gammaproteobacteria bacterium]|nr:calcium-binding protein [Gammaproteobacteria bacterium]
MKINFFGPDPLFFGTAFLNVPSGLTVLTSSSTKIKLKHPDTGAITTLFGSGFTFDANGDPTGGTLSGVTFKQSGSVVADYKNFSWDMVDFLAALDAARVDDFSQINALFSQQTLKLDATTATTGYEFQTNSGVEITGKLILQGSDFADELEGGSENDRIFGNGGEDVLRGFGGKDSIYGGAGDDVIDGGAKKDTITTGTSVVEDRVIGSLGNDSIVFTDSTSGYQLLDYAGISTKITVSIDGTANTGSVIKAGKGTDTLIDVMTPLGTGLTGGGLGIFGTLGRDTFTIDGGAGTWMQIGGGQGQDVFNLTLSSDIRLVFDWDGHNVATQGLDIDVSKGTVYNDGFGFKDTLNITTGAGQLQIRGTDLADDITGSSAAEGFVSGEGDDTIDGKGGDDVLYYNQANVGAVTVDLSTGTATGTWGGNAFADTLTSIEDVYGSLSGDDILIGSGKGNEIYGLGGDDSIDGGAGDDLLYGGDDNDTVTGGKGADTLTGGGGDDTLTGGDDIDRFVFLSGDQGTDVITDFDNGSELIEIHGFSFGDLVIAQIGSYTEITWGTSLVTLEGETGVIDAADFLFV